MAQSSHSKVKDFRLHINREGYFLYLILFAVGFAAYNTGNNLLFLFVSLMASLSITHALLNFVARQKNDLQRRLPPTLFAGEPFPVTLSITNRKRFFSTFSIILREESRDLQSFGRTHFLRIPPGETLEKRYEAVLPRRGVFHFEGIWLECRYPFGLTMNAIRYELPEQCVVFPRLQAIHDESILQTGRHGDIERHEKGFGFNLYGLREYREGESSRLIHWRTSAKLDQPMLKEFEDEMQRHLTILFESTGDPTLVYDEVFEQAVSQAASLAAYYTAANWQVELITLSGSIPHGTGNAHLRRILYHLALIQPATFSPAEAQRRLLGRIHSDAGRIIWVNRQGNLSPEVVEPDTIHTPGARG